MPLARDHRKGRKVTKRRLESGMDRRSIVFGFTETSLGLALAAASSTGICAIFLGDARSSLLLALRQRFPQDELVEGEGDFLVQLSLVASFIEQPRLERKFGIDVQGTDFQRQVWQALRDIPPGSTVSYAQIARRIGRPRSVRAVAGACAANKIAVAIPCHRVLRSDGDISGYRWGVERKRKLLEREAPGAMAQAWLRPTMLSS